MCVMRGSPRIHFCEELTPEHCMGAFRFISFGFPRILEVPMIFRPGVDLLQVNFTITIDGYNEPTTRPGSLSEIACHPIAHQTDEGSEGVCHHLPVV